MEISVKLNLSRQPTEDEEKRAMQLIVTQLRRRVAEKFTQANPAGWRQRMNPNIAGILEDLRVSANIRARRFERGIIGFDSGRLSDSLDFRISGRNELEFFGLEYGKQFHLGGRREIKIDNMIRQNLKQYYKKNKKNFKQKNIGWIFGIVQKNAFRFNQFPRPLLVQQDVVEVATAVYEYLFKKSK